MYRFLAFAWNASDHRQAAVARLLAERLHPAASAWRCRVSRRGLSAYDAGARSASSDSHVFAGGRGGVFGTLFARTSGAKAAPVTQLREPEGREILAAGAPRLVEHYWGRYVAIAESETADRVWILRDPSGALPCSLTTFRDVHIVFSDLEDVLALGLLTFTVNWDYVTAAVASSALQVRETGLNEVSEILPGECVTLGQGPTEAWSDGPAELRCAGPLEIRRSFVWSPITVAQRQPIENAAQAAAELHDATHACVGAWSTRYAGVLLSLSGGLDSSIVLNCLARSSRRPEVTCLNYFTTGRDDDERPYARLAARQAGVRLLERELRTDLPLEQVLQVRRSAKPAYYVAPLQRQRLESELAHEVGADAIFSGGGGDAVFYQGRPDLAVADFVRRRGPRPAVWGVAMDAARISGVSVWSLLGRGLRTALMRSEWSPPLPESRSISDQQRGRESGRWRHPWLENTRGVAHGTLWHALSLSVPTTFYESFDRPDDPERSYPLLSQPLVEVCLRIPTYVLICGGWDRAIARRAFAGEMPADILRRRSKGGINHLSTQILDANIGFVRELLLDGLLVRHGILERGRLEQCLSGKRAPTDYEYNQILHEYLSIEAWLRRGSELHARAAA